MRPWNFQVSNWFVTVAFPGQELVCDRDIAQVKSLVCDLSMTLPGQGLVCVSSITGL